MCNECRHIMPNGLKCRAPALRGKPYCYFHTRLHRLAVAPPRKKEEPFKLPILEDRSAIQLAIAQVLDAMGSVQFDPRQAGLYLYAIQLASQNVERGTDIVPSTAVHRMTVTQSGDELGPEKTTCPFPHDCSTCDVSKDCEDFELDEEEEDEEEEEG